MSLKKQIAHNTILQIIGKIISTALGLIALGMLTRYLGTEKYGWYTTTLAFLQFVGILIDFGLIPVSAQMLGEAKFEKNKLFNNLFSYRFFSALIFLALAPLISLFFPYPTEVKIAIGFSTISFLSIALNQILVGNYQTKLKMLVQVIGENIGRLFLVIGLYFLIKKQADFLPIMFLMVISNLAYTAVMFIHTHLKEYKIRFSFDKTIWLAITKKMWPVAISIIFNVVYLKGDTLLLTFFSSQTEVGFYGAAYKVLDVLTQTAMMLMGLFLPLLAFSWGQNLKQEFKERWQLSFDAMMILAVPMTAGLYALADKTMFLIAGQNFAPAGQVLKILSLAIFGVYLGAIFGHSAVAINRQKETIKIYLISAIVTLIGYLIFIPKYGMYGAAWMSVFSEFFTGFGLYFIIKKYIKEKITLKTFYKIIFSSFIMILFLNYFQNLNIFILVFIGIIVYSLMIIITKAVARETIWEIFNLKK
ncbi:MAG: flippase [Patescibacteria group bacterium]